jgi:hypothetical protein
MQPTNKTQAVKFILERAEGPTALCGTVTVSTWEEAEKTLRDWAKTAPTLGCDKCDIEIVFDNDDSFKGGFDLQKKHEVAANLADVVRKELLFMAGKWMPSHMTKKQHEDYLKWLNVSTAEYQKCLDTWVIPDNTFESSNQRATVNLNPDTLTQADLEQFTGTENWYQHWLGVFQYTDGIKFLAEKAKAYWLLDAIASHQPTCLKDSMLRQIQFWKLNVENNTAFLICERDLGDVFLTQTIAYTDFPLQELTLYVENGVLCLPSER